MADPIRRMGIHTTAIHAGESPDAATGALVPPLHLATTYHLGTAENSAAIFAGEKDAYVYTRWGNPTVAAFERKAAALEQAEAAVATASGMAAIASAMLTVVKSGDHIVSANAIYPSTYHLMVTQLGSLGIETTFVDATDPANVERAIRPQTKLVYLETPGNPLLTLCDLEAIGAIARQGRHRHDLRQHVRVAGEPAAPRARDRHRRPQRHQGTSAGTATRSAAWWRGARPSSSGASPSRSATTAASWRRSMRI